MTPAQRALYDAVCTCWRKHGYGPSYNELLVAIGRKSKGEVHRLAAALIRAGYLEHTRQRARSLRPRELPPIELVRACERLLASIVNESEPDDNGRVTMMIDADALGEIELILIDQRAMKLLPSPEEPR